MAVAATYIVGGRSSKMAGLKLFMVADSDDGNYVPTTVTTRFYGADCSNLNQKGTRIPVIWLRFRTGFDAGDVPATDVGTSTRF
ncbi:hypothetical protein O9993_12165 [Vibrio lentus]|nr:hypothetical protein [Vibrio lentus]